MLSPILYGTRRRWWSAWLGVMVPGALGIGLGLVAGYLGGAVDTLIMRVADIQLTFPAILMAIVIGGYHGARPPAALDVNPARGLVVVSLGLSFWVHFARPCAPPCWSRTAGTTSGRPTDRSPVDHDPARPPERGGPIFVIAALDIAFAIIAEATLKSWAPACRATKPSLGTLIRTGNRYLFSGEWWLAIFPGVTLEGLVMAINLMGDWLRDALNPKLR